MRVAAEVVLTEEQAAQLKAHARGRRTAARLVLRARIVLLAAEGKQDLEIAATLGIVPRTAARWRARFLTSGVAGLEKDAPRGGRATVLTQQTVRRIVALTTQQKPVQATHWSTRTMAAAAGVSEASVRRVWRAHGLKPHRFDSFKLSNDPHFAEKLEDIIGLYLNPPEHALVLSLDEKSQIQALDRTQPGLPMKKGRAQTMTHDYKRHGTTTLFAALNTLDGTVMATCMPRHRHQEWLKFLRLIDCQTPPGKQLHLIVDNYATHKHPAVQAWAESTRAFIFTSPQPPAVGSIWSNASSATSPKTNSGEASSAASTHWRRQSKTTSHCITSSPNPSSGPLTHPTSSKRSNEVELPSITAYLLDALH